MASVQLAPIVVPLHVVWLGFIPAEPSDSLTQ